MITTEITTVEKTRFVRDGFVVLRNVVPRELTSRARRAIHAHGCNKYNAVIPCTQTSIESLCDHWRDWDGLQDQVAAMRAGDSS